MLVVLPNSLYLWKKSEYALYNCVLAQCMIKTFFSKIIAPLKYWKISYIIEV